MWGEWKSSECSKEGERELSREVAIPETLFGERCQGPDHKTEQCEMPKGKCKSFLDIFKKLSFKQSLNNLYLQSVSGVHGLHFLTALDATSFAR